jgi:penicillin-binding protein 1C
MRETLVIAVIVSLFASLGVVAAVVYLYWYEAPDISALRSASLAQTTVLYDRTGEHILYELYGEENRKVISPEEIPDVVRLATIAAEDAEFYRHWGVDPFAAMRALRANVRSGDIEEGGSTITMQLVRNLYLSREKTFERKVTEAILALKLEQSHTKDEILHWYLNTIPYGSNAYGIQAAAEVFFAKPAKELTLDEAAFLAALPKATTYYSPYGENASNLIDRKRHILDRMVFLGMIDSKDRDSAVSVDTLAKVAPNKNNILAPHFVFFVLSQLEREYGEDVLRIGGLHVKTTLDWEMQQRAEEVVRTGALRNASEYNAENAALVALDPKTGGILAMAGSRGYFDTEIDGEVNVATRPRQPGSAFKPIVYAKVLELGLQPDSLVYDVRTSFGPDGSGGEYIPRNYSGTFSGLLTLKEALSRSLNVPAVKMLSIAGLDNALEFSRRLGITTLTDRDRYGLSLVLGGGEVTLLDLTSAFSVFANDGVRNAAIGILDISGVSGNALSLSNRVPERVIDAQIARKINDMLSDNDARAPVFGSSSPLFFPDADVAAKTGTTQEWRDGWTVGYTPDIAVGVWTGNNDNHPMRLNADGVYVAAPIWNEYMRFAIDRFGAESFLPYDEYERSPLPMIGGRGVSFSVRYYDVQSGDEISAEEASTKDANDVRINNVASGHSLLYYVNQAKFPSAPVYDPAMISRWDAAIRP